MRPTKDRTHHEDLPDRRIGCKWYGRCLDVALASGWSGFSCSRCDGFEADHLGPEESRAETEGCVLLLWAVRHPEAWWNMSLGVSKRNAAVETTYYIGEDIDTSPRRRRIRSSLRGGEKGLTK